MSMFNENYPNVAYYIQDAAQLNNREAFKCRIVSEAGQFFTTSISGLVDTGTNMSLVTWKKLPFKQGAKVIINDVFYSVQSITPFVPDPTMQGFTKAKTQVNYLIQLV